MFQVDDDVYIDALDIRTSNWLRFINCASFPDQLNLVPRHCDNRIHYITSRDIAPGEELLVFYGYRYADNLGVDILPFFVHSMYGDRYKKIRVAKQDKVKLSRILTQGYFYMNGKKSAESPMGMVSKHYL